MSIELLEANICMDILILQPDAESAQTSRDYAMLVRMVSDCRNADSWPQAS